ncbi:MAG: hypothetical protein E4H38_03285, partial [Gemmatimonadales bacterium]
MILSSVVGAFERTAFALELRDRLPSRGAQLGLGGLPGSSPAVMAAWLAQRHPSGLLTIIATTPADAERWVSDLRQLTEVPVGLYPQRESLGEEEQHYEIAGERAETLAALLNGKLRVLVTTARASQERTRIAAMLRGETLRLQTGAGGAPPLSEVARALAAMGYARVATVTEVAQYSVRGGIIDLYGFGMAAPARLEYW